MPLRSSISPMNNTTGGSCTAELCTMSSTTAEFAITGRSTVGM